MELNEIDRATVKNTTTTALRRGFYKLGLSRCNRSEMIVAEIEKDTRVSVRRGIPIAGRIMLEVFAKR